MVYLNLKNKFRHKKVSTGTHAEIPSLPKVNPITKVSSTIKFTGIFSKLSKIRTTKGKRLISK